MMYHIVLTVFLVLTVVIGNCQKIYSTHFTGVTRELNTKKVVNARIEIVDLETSETVYLIKSGNQGVIKTKLHQGKKYVVTVSNRDYVGVKDTLTITKEGKVSARVDTFYLAKPALKMPMIQFEGYVFDRASGKKISASMIGEVFNSRIEHFNFSIQTDSHYVFQIIAFKNQKVTISAEGFLPQEFNFNPQDYTGKKQVNKDFYLTRLTPDDFSVLSSVHFVQSHAEIISGSELELLDLARYLKQHPNVKVELAGHTDNVGVKKLNVKLSEERVQTITTFLISQGIDSNRISGKGFGGESPIASNDNEQSRKLNRRVEFKLSE